VLAETPSNRIEIVNATVYDKNPKTFLLLKGLVSALMEMHTIEKLFRTKGQV
jgi:hypothetical protein